MHWQDKSTLWVITGYPLGEAWWKISLFGCAVIKLNVDVVTESVTATEVIGSENKHAFSASTIYKSGGGKMLVVGGAKHPWSNDHRNFIYYVNTQTGVPSQLIYDYKLLYTQVNEGIAPN